VTAVGSLFVGGGVAESFLVWIVDCGFFGAVSFGARGVSNAVLGADGGAVSPSLGATLPKGSVEARVRCGVEDDTEPVVLLASMLVRLTGCRLGAPNSGETRDDLVPVVVPGTTFFGAAMDDAVVASFCRPPTVKPPIGFDCGLLIFNLQSIT
jgi:hypothetical protein